MLMASDWITLLNTLTNYCLEDEIGQQILTISNDLKVLKSYQNEFINKEIYKWIDSILKTSTNAKSTQKSVELRNLGNKKFKVGDYEASLKLYTESIIYAPNNTSEFALALGNRSATLFRLEQFEYCISDIDLALQECKNDELYLKLMIRKGKSLIKLKHIKDGNNCLSHVKEFIISQKNFPKSAKDEILNEVNNEYYTADFESVDQEKKSSLLLPAVSKERHNSFPSASSLINLQVSGNGDEDRTVIACDNIKAGDILFVEPPFSCIILPDYYTSHCQTCGKLLYAPIACCTCINCLYCNENCYLISYNLYHKWECNGLSILHDLGIGHVALKTVLIASHDPSSYDYERICNLVTHLNDVPLHDLLQYVLVATLLIIYLEKFTNFFNDCVQITWKSVQNIGFLLLKHMLQVICNGFGVDKSIVDNDDFSTVIYASAFYPSASMMNHSCEPNIITSFYNNLLVVRANRQIAIGEEIFNCYGPHFRKTKFEERQDILKNQYFFNCKCKHCLKSLNEDKDEYSLYICSYCGNSISLNLKNAQTEDLLFKCRFCFNICNLRYYLDRTEKVNNLFKKAVTFMEEKNYEQASNIFKKCKMLQQLFMDKNHYEIMRCTINLANCCFISGDYSNSWKYFNEYLPVIKKQYGDYSVEYGCTIYKIIRIFLIEVNNKQNIINILDRLSDVRKYINELETIVTFNFGTWSDAYLVIEKRKSEITNLENVHSSILRLAFMCL